MAEDPKPKQRVSDRSAKQKREHGGAAEPAPARRGLPAVAEAGNRATLAKLRQTGGAPLAGGLRKEMEQKFGADFKDVRVHANATAAELAASETARAFTLGNDIVFGKGELAPHTTAGRSLIAHELAHVRQQELGKALGRVGSKAATESDARRAARAIEEGGPVQVAEAAGPVIQREELNFTPATDPAGMRKRVAMVNDGGEVSGTLDGHVIIRGTAQPETKCHVQVTGLQVTYYVDTFGSNLAFTADAPSFTQANAPGYNFSSSHRIQEGPYIPPFEVPDPVVPPPKKSAPTPKKSAPKPKQPTPKQPEVNPAVYDPLHDDPSPYKHVDYSPAEQMHQALQDHDLAKAADLASQLGDSDLQALTPVERSLLLWGLALNPTNDDLDLDEVERIFNNTPDFAVMELQHALRAGNGQLLEELRSHAKGDDATRLGNAVAGLVARGLASGAAALDFSMADALEPPPIVLPEEAKTPTWVGGEPDWAKGMKVWTDARGNWNFFDEQHGLTTMDMFGKTSNRNWAPGGDLINRMKKGFKDDEELRLTDGLHYVKGQGLVNEEQWQNHLLQQFLQHGADANNKIQNLEGAVKSWNETQSGFASIPSFFAHAFGGANPHEPQRILDNSKFDVKYGLAQIGKARTSTGLNESLGHLDFATKSGSALLSQHQDKVIGGGETTIFVIKVGAVTAVVVATGGYAMTAAPTVLSLQGAGYAFGGGMVFSAGRQGVQLAEGTRKDFSGLEMLGGGVAGVGLYVAPFLMVPASGYGMANSLNEAEKGHYGTFAFDMLAPLAGAGVTSPRFTKFVLPYALGTAMRAGSEIPGFSGRAYAPSLGTGPEIVMVMPGQGGARAPAPFEIVLPEVAPNPSAFVSPTVNPSPSTASPYNFPLIFNFTAPTTVTPSAAEAGPKGVADAYKSNAPTIDANPLDFKIGGALRPGVAGTGEAKPYWQFGRKDGAGGADYLDPALLPFAGLSKPLLATTDEHIHPTAGVKSFLPSWSKGGAPALRWPLSVARMKTQMDLKLIADVKNGTITPSQFIKESRANIWRVWERAKANGDVVPTEKEVSAAIADHEAKLRTEMAAAGLPTNDW